MKQIEKIWLTDTEIWIRTTDGEEAAESFADYPRLRYATKEQRENFETDAFGIHWPDIDEDLNFEGFLKKKNKTALYEFFLAHPELNAAAVGRRLGMTQSLFAQYISGSKRPSKERAEMIKAEIRRIGTELSNLNLQI